MKDINCLVRNIVKPITKNYSPVLLILTRNWENIIGEKYAEFCEVEKVSFQKNKKNDGTIYIKAFNNVISFYIENNKEFILEKINSIFGYFLISKIFIKQTPKIVKQYQQNTKKISDNNKEFLNKLIQNFEENELKKSLNELGISILKNKS